MKEIEKILVADLLDISSEKFSNHTCNDLDEDVYCGWTTQQKKDFSKEFWLWMGEDDINELPLMDSFVMDFMSHKMRLKKETP